MLYIVLASGQDMEATSKLRLILFLCFRVWCCSLEIIALIFKVETELIWFNYRPTQTALKIHPTQTFTEGAFLTLIGIHFIFTQLFGMLHSDWSNCGIQRSPWKKTVYRTFTSLTVNSIFVVLYILCLIDCKSWENFSVYFADNSCNFALLLGRLIYTLWTVFILVKV